MGPTRQVLPASSVTRALSLIGDSWTLLVLLNAFRGARRYGDWLQVLRIPRPALSSRLERLVKARILKKSIYQSNPPRFEYLLTPRGLDLWNSLLAIWDWQKHWLPEQNALASELVHDVCQQSVLPVFSCAACEQKVSAPSVVREPGPGAGVMRMPMSRQRRPVMSGGPDPSFVFHDATARIFGDRWSMLLVRSALRGVSRFNDFQAQLDISTQLLTLRLRELVALGIFERVQYSSSPERFEYKLTEKGTDIYELGVFLMCWGDRWLPLSSGAPTLLYHQDCGALLTPELRCSHCNTLLDYDACHFEPIPFTDAGLEQEMGTAAVVAG
jgi:DNA-binding HxlR family transcriptional regulator